MNFNKLENSIIHVLFRRIYEQNGNSNKVFPIVFLEVGDI